MKYDYLKKIPDSFIENNHTILQIQWKGIIISKQVKAEVGYTFKQNADWNLPSLKLIFLWDFQKNKRNVSGILTA